jgi:hypothetical protein
MIYTCDNCEKHTNFVPIQVHLLPDAGPPEEYTFARCEVCDRPALFLREDIGIGFENDDYYRMFPAHDRHIGFALPKVVRTSYEEAVRCENSKSWIACVTMVGRTLEAVTKAYDPTQRTMFAGLQAMYKNGAISQEIHEWANELRVIRNYGAHASDEPIDRQDASEALDFLQAILELLYYMRPKFQQMQARRAKPVA